MYDVADHIADLVSPEAAKAYAKDNISVCKEMHEVKFDIMLQICQLSAEQSAAYHYTLLNSGDRPLIHNMELDPE